VFLLSTLHLAWTMESHFSPSFCAIKRNAAGGWVKEQVVLAAAGTQRVNRRVLQDEDGILTVYLCLLLF
jgi:hypothetical protein